MELVSQLWKMMQMGAHIYSTSIFLVCTFDMNLTFNLYYIVEYDFEYSDIGCYEEEPTLMSAVITLDQISDPIDFNNGTSHEKSGIVTTNQDSEEVKMSAYFNWVNTAHQE